MTEKAPAFPPPADGRVLSSGTTSADPTFNALDVTVPPPAWDALKNKLLRHCTTQERAFRRIEDSHERAVALRYLSVARRRIREIHAALGRRDVQAALGVAVVLGRLLENWRIKDVAEKDFTAGRATRRGQRNLTAKLNARKKAKAAEWQALARGFYAKYPPTMSKAERAREVGKDLLREHKLAIPTNTIRTHLKN